MMHGYLCYERADALVNAAFIEQVLSAALQEQIELTVVYPDEISRLACDVSFVWNRSRQAIVAEHFERLGIRVFNNARTNKIANDKLLAQRFVSALGVASIPSFESFNEVVNYPVVVKSVDGHGGQEVVLCHDAANVLQQLDNFGHKKVIIQPFIESNAQDVRVWMLGSNVLGAVLRTGETDFKSNYTLGGTIEKFELPIVLMDAVDVITTALRSDYIGIDFIKGVDGQFYFNEIEDPVGAKSYYELYDWQLPERLIKYIISELNQSVD